MNSSSYHHILLKFFLLAFILCLTPVHLLANSEQFANSVSVIKPKIKKKSQVILGSYKDLTRAKKRSTRALIAAQKRGIKRQVSARSAIVIDSQTGKTLFARAPDRARQPASTIKVLTGIIAIKSLDNQDTISVSRRAANQPSSKIHLNQRKKYQANDLINAVLLASANDASVALAEKIAGSEKAFAQMMTLRAKLWGATTTVCKTATGLTARGQKSTARDLAAIFRFAMKEPEFAARMKRTKVRTVDGKLLRNHNKALWKLEGTEGGKTGYTNAARQTYVGKFKKGDAEIIVAILGSETMWADLKRLVEHGFSQKLLMKEIAAHTPNPPSAEMIIAQSLPQN